MSEGRQDAMAGGDIPLFSVAAHELKSPLALIRQLSQTAGSDNYSEAELIKLLDRINLTSERALRLTTDLTKVQRLEDSLFDLEPVNSLSICEEVVEEIRPLYQARGQQIEVIERRSAPLIVAHRDLLRRILLNFADNALNYAQSDTPVKLSATSIDSGRRVRLQVRDYGPGLPSDIRRRLQTGPAPVAWRPASSGLGVYLARQFASVMNGNIGVISHHDGASFYVELDQSAQLRLL